MPEHQPSNDVIVERIDSLRKTLREADEAAGERIDRLDQSINGRFGRIEKRVSALELTAARNQGAAEERDRLGLDPSHLPPPVRPSDGTLEVPRWAKTLVFVLSGIAGVLTAVALILQYA